MKRISCALTLLLLLGQALRADGGLLQFRQTSNDYSVSVFTAPTPLRVGVVDVSLLVQNRDGEAVLGSVVKLRLVSPNGSEKRVIATDAEATNKLMSATAVNFDRSGRWRVFVTVISAGKQLTEVQGEISVDAAASPASTYWSYIAVVPAALLLFVANQLLKRRRTYGRKLS